jgi:hypothetical protein
MTTPRTRPFGVTLLAILAVIAAIAAAAHALQALGILPYVFGPVQVQSFSLWYAIMWGLLVWVYIWLVRMLWNMEPAAWIFLVFITIWNLTLDFFVVLGTGTFSDVSVSFIINAVILLYCMLPGVRQAFGTTS